MAALQRALGNRGLGSFLQAKLTAGPSAADARAQGAGATGKRAAQELEASALGGDARPLSDDTREFFEPRFGRDFGGVRVHDDTAAHQAARSIGARAFTAGRDIFFGQDQYQPGRVAGRALIAHELTHTIQQGNGDPARGTLAEPRVQRKVSAEWGKIHEKLTYHWLDWAVTDSDAHAALMILKALNDADLKDTVAEMEKDDLVDRLFGNVSNDDRLRESQTLERINGFRVRTGKVDGKKVTSVGPCEPEQTREIDKRIGTTKDWAKRSKDKVSEFIADPATNGVTGALLDRHFFHQEWAGKLPQATQNTHAARIRDNLEKVEKQTAVFVNWCAGPFDSLCRALAEAYVSTTAHRIVYCPSFFSSGEKAKTYSLFHELMHAHAGVDDRGYGDERIFLHLPPDQSINNADSYALFAVDALGIGKGAKSFRDIPGSGKDSIADCVDIQKRMVLRDFAFASRMITNALNVIGDPGLATDLLDTHFKTHDPKELERVVERFKKIKDKFDGQINFECEKNCDVGIAGYYRRGGWTVHLCPDYFGMAPDDRREDRLLMMTVWEELGLGDIVLRSDPRYAKQSEKEAYKNPESYAAYARDVTKRFWR